MRLRDDMGNDLAGAVFGETKWCDRCNRTTRACLDADDCHEPEPLPSSGVSGADRFFDAPRRPS